MRRSGLQFEENYDEYLRLLQNDDYLEVTLDEESGGVSAVNKLHKFDKKIGAFGVRRGEYEIRAVEVLRKRGHRIVLEAELSSGDKKCDGILDDIPVEIKAIEGNGTWSISTKLRAAQKQHAQSVVLYFPKEELYSSIRVSEGIRLALSSPENNMKPSFSRLLVIVRDQLVAEWDKKTTPIEGWSLAQ